MLSWRYIKSVLSWVRTASRTPTPVAFATTLLFHCSFLPFLEKSALSVTITRRNNSCALLPGSLGGVAVVELLAQWLPARGDWGINKPGGKLGSLMPCKGIANNICVFSRIPLFISELCGGGHRRRRLCVSLTKHRRNWKCNKLMVFWCKWEMKDQVWDELQYLNQLLVFQTSSIPVRLIITATASLSVVRDAESQNYFGIQLVVGPLRICVDSRVTKWVRVALSLDNIVLSYFNKEEQWSGRNKMDATKIRGIMRSFALGWSTSSLELVLKVFRFHGVGNLQTWCFLFLVSFHSSPFSALDISDSWEHKSFLV